MIQGMENLFICYKHSVLEVRVRILRVRVNGSLGFGRVIVQGFGFNS